MNKKRNTAKVLISVLLLTLVFHTWTQAKETKMYIYYINETGSVSQTDGMDAVAAVKTTKSSLTGINFNGATKELTLNGLQADTLRIYTKKINVKGTNQLDKIFVNTTVQEITAAAGATLAGEVSGKKAEEFSKKLAEEMTVANNTASKGSITLDKTQATIYSAGNGNTITLKATKQGTETIKWSSSDSNVATVNNGLVTGKKAGTAVITAALINSKGQETDKATCTITVNAPVIALDKSSATIYTKGENSSLTLTATVNKTKAAGNTVTWTSSDKTVATVNNGTVTPQKKGTVTITAAFGGATATCKVTVKEPTLSLNKSSATIYTKGVKTITLVATENGTEVAGANVTWKSSDTSIAKVENGKVTAVAKGEATITAKANGISKTCKITVKKPSISVSPTSVTVKKGKKATLTTTVKPGNGTEKPTYKSSKKSVATVDSNGVITGVAAGEATITVSCYGVSATVKVTVTK